MIYLFTALYCEAQIFIEQFHLKKVMDSIRFQQFVSESGQILLTVSGAGEIAAAAAVGSVCTKCPPNQNDFLLNAGICGGPPDRDGVFLIHKLTEETTGKTFYPDMLYPHEFQEAALWTFMKPWRRNAQAGSSKDVYLHGALDHAGGNSDIGLYDMEAAAIYQAGAYFFGPQQMLFLKVISDSGEGNRLAGEFVKRRMELYRRSICGFIEQLLQMIKQQGCVEPLYDQERQEQWICRLCADLHCSKAMEDSIRQYLHYAILAGIDYKKVVQKLYEENRLPCRDKREGKRCFEAFKQRLL